MTRPPPVRPPELPTLPSVDDVQFVERLGDGIGSGRFKARLSGHDGYASILLEHEARIPRAAFIDWAHRLVRLDHPTIPRVVRIEAVLEPAFVAFAFMEGRLTSEIIADSQNRVPPLTALTLTLQIASGLRIAHRAGLVHGALAPRAVVLSKREQGTDAVYVTGWMPCAEPVDPAAFCADTRAVAYLLYSLLTGIAPPSLGRSSSGSDDERNSDSFDQIVLGWEDAQRNLGGTGELCAALIDGVGIFGERATAEPMDALIDLIVPHHRALCERVHVDLEERLRVGRDFMSELTKKRAQIHEHESRIRSLRQWMREQATTIDAADTQLGQAEAETRLLRSLELEVSVLLERKAPPARPVITGSAPLLPPVDLPVDPAPATQTTAQLLKVSTPPDAVLPPPLPLEVSEPPPKTTPVRVRRRVVVDRDESMSQAIGHEGRGTRSRGVFTGAVVVVSLIALALFLMRNAQEHRPARTAASEPPSTASTASTSPPAVSMPPAASAPPPVSAVPPVSAPPPEPPPGMAYIPAGRVVMALSAVEVDAVLAQCRLDYGDRPQAKGCERTFLEAEVTVAEPVLQLPAFFIDRFEVSQLRYNLCSANGKCPVLRLKWDLPEQPATGLDRRSAAAFCRFEGGRLPSRNEFLRAGRGDEGRVFPWGNQPAWIGEEHRANSGAFTNGRRNPGRADGHPYAGPVTILSARGQSPFGVVNLSGNVREWTSNDTRGGGVIVGGGWKSLGHELRLTRVEVLRPTEFSSDLGFRCVRDVEVRP